MLKRLSQLRKHKKWSLQYTADRLGIAKSTYAGYESGYREPSLEQIKKLADLMETSVDYLLARVDNLDTNVKEEKIRMNVKLELTEPTSLSKIELALDGKTLAEEELKHLVAFIRARREVEKQHVTLEKA